MTTYVEHRAAVNLVMEAIWRATPEGAAPLLYSRRKRTAEVVVSALIARGWAPPERNSDAETESKVQQLQSDPDAYFKQARENAKSTAARIVSRERVKIERHR